MCIVGNVDHAASSLQVCNDVFVCGLYIPAPKQATHAHSKTLRALYYPAIKGTYTNDLQHPGVALPARKLSHFCSEVTICIYGAWYLSPKLNDAY